MSANDPKRTLVSIKPLAARQLGLVDTPMTFYPTWRDWPPRRMWIEENPEVQRLGLTRFSQRHKAE